MRQGLAARIDAALPQTQCTRCGYPDCAAYAQAVAHEGAPINRCPPGGAEGVARLAALTGRPALPLDPACGAEAPRTIAVIDENWCIGCTLCIQACPTDAILGTHKHMHTVIAGHCTGCELCIPVCPVDCISLEDATPGRSGWQAWSPAQAAHARARYALHGQHRPTDARQGKKRPEAEVAAPSAEARKRSVVEAALARARAAAQRPSTPKP